MKTFTWIVVLVFLVAASSGQNASTKKQPGISQPEVPTQAEIEQALKRVYGYDPSIQWKVFVVRRSAIPGMNEVLLQLKNEFHHLFLTADGHYAIDGEMQPFAVDPYAIMREKLKEADGVVRGPAKPAVMMVEFSDLQCPHCKEAQPVIEKLAADFPEMRIVFQNYPLAARHPWAMKAAQYVDCAGRMDGGAAWKFIAAVYESQDGIAAVTADEKLKELATASGLDANKVSNCTAAPETEQRIKKSMALGDSLGIMGTPSIFVNGRMLENVAGTPYEQVKAIVHYEIQNAGK